MAFARKTDDAQHRAVIRVTPKGVEATEWYLVDTDDIRKVMDAPGIPAADDPLDPVKYPNVLCYNVVAEEKTGGDDDSTGRIGWIWLRVDYATPGAGSFTQPNLYPGQKWTEIQNAERSETVYADINATSDPIIRINDGDGYAKEKGLTILVVNRCWELDHQPDFPLYNTLNRDRPFNNAPITVPKLFGAGAQWTIAPEGAQYKGFEVQVQGKVLIVRHFLQLGLSKEITWRHNKPDGSGYNVVTQIFSTASFSGLW